ncbi:hypothetical protein JOC45_004056 [Gordonia hydrophobica]|nr:hypothetical protein [Gordonia hydrophobica]
MVVGGVALIATHSDQPEGTATAQGHAPLIVEPHHLWFPHSVATECGNHKWLRLDAKWCGLGSPSLATATAASPDGAQPPGINR